MLTDLHRPVFLQVDELREEEGVPRRPDRDPVEARGEEAKVHRGSIYGLLRGELAEALALPGVVIEGEDGALVAREEVVPEADRQVMGGVLELEPALPERRAVVPDGDRQRLPASDVL